MLFVKIKQPLVPNSFLILCAEIPLLCRTSVNFANLATGLNLRVVIDDHSSHLIKIDGSPSLTELRPHLSLISDQIHLYRVQTDQFSPATLRESVVLPRHPEGECVHP